jgi:uncharacterized protein YlaI
MRRKWSGPIRSLQTGRQGRGLSYETVKEGKKQPFRGQFTGGCKVKFRTRPEDRVQEGHFKNPKPGNARPEWEKRVVRRIRKDGQQTLNGWIRDTEGWVDWATK